MNGLTNKQWNLPPPTPQEFIDRMAEWKAHPVIAQILYRRGFTDAEQAAELFSVYTKDDNPFSLKGMTEAVYRLRMAIRSREQIAIYGDFDCDGVCSTVVLTQALQKLGANVRPYIPSRVDEGYGLNSPALKTLADEGVKVVVTVDCGIRSVQEVIDGNSYGLDMIISDHHSIGPELPPALAVINPKQLDCTYPEKMLAGVGLAYKIAQAMFMEAHRRGYEKAGGWHPSDWLDLVAIGTVADIAPLLGENRMLVQEGLRKLNAPERAGLKALYGVSGVKSGRISAVTIGFFLGPRINAAGRLRSALLAYDLLTAGEMSQAVKLAEDLNALNQERQQKTEMMQGWAEEQMDTTRVRPLLFAADERFEQGVVGLVASRLTETYYRPSVVVQIGHDESHGSCRSIPEFHITHALDQCSDLLERHGGHAAAAGFTVRNDMIEPLKARLQEIAEGELVGQELVPSLEIDAELPLSQATFETADALAGLEPTGEANRTPLFMARDISVIERRTVGAEGRHLKLTLTDGANRVDAIAFRLGELAGSVPERIDVAFNLETDEWNDRRRLQLNVRDLRPAAGLFEG